MSWLIIFSVEADATFASINNQLLSRWGKKESLEFRKRTFDVIENLKKFPFMFQAVEQVPEVRKAFIHKNCLMYYQVGSDKIDILFFWDNRQEPVF